MDQVLSAVLEFLFELFLLGTARILIAILTFGRWRSASEKESVVEASGGALSFRKDGQRAITIVGQQVIGVVFWVALIAFFIWLASRR